MRYFLAKLFVCYPALAIVYALQILKGPLVWTADLFSQKLVDRIHIGYVKLGIWLYYWMQRALAGKAHAELAVLLLLVAYEEEQDLK